MCVCVCVCVCKNDFDIVVERSILLVLPYTLSCSLCSSQTDVLLALLLVGEGSGTPLQYSCLENPMDGGAWWAPVHRIAESQTRLSDFTFTFTLFHALGTLEGAGAGLRAEKVQF